MTRNIRLGRTERLHGAALPTDRRELEAAGWRTTLEYRENHARARDGRLTCLQVVWHAEAERADRSVPGSPLVVSATAPTPEQVWSRLRTQADLAGGWIDRRRAAVADMAPATGRRRPPIRRHAISA